MTNLFRRTYHAEFEKRHGIRVVATSPVDFGKLRAMVESGNVEWTVTELGGQDYVRAHGWGLDRPEGRMIALLGDAEMDEGNIFEALLEGWKQGLRNTWWIIDYNRQSLDAVIREGLWERYEQLFKNFGWDVVIIKNGSLQQAAFKEPGGDKLRQWIDSCPNQLYSALVFAGGAAWRKRLLDRLEQAKEPVRDSRQLKSRFGKRAA